MSKQTTGREIKFRAWSTKWKKMVYPHDNELHITIGNDDIHTIWKDSVDEEGVPIMQFTGLKDKNGKEIYEGDIISATFVELHTVKGEVLWDQDRFIVTGAGVGLSSFAHPSRMEVIGNVYENTNLLP